MEKVEFKFTIDQRVTTPFDDEGIIVMLGFDDGGKCYFVKSAKDSKWFKEKELTSE